MESSSYRRGLGRLGWRVIGNSDAFHGKHEMIFLVLTDAGWAQTASVLQRGASEAWVNGGILEDTEIERLHEDGYKLTVMARWIDPADREDVADVLVTVQEHHPGQPVFVEYPHA